MKKIHVFIILIMFVLQGITQNGLHLQKVIAADREAGARFGNAVSISGNYAIIAAKFENENATGQDTLASAGAAYIFEKDTTTGQWQQVQKLVASDRADGDHFGFSVAIDGNYALVGANREAEDETGNNRFANAGSAYIFERNPNGVWQEVQKLVAGDRNAGHEFGYSVALEGDLAFVGAYHEGSGANPSWTFWQGAVYVFQRNSNGTWNPFQKIKANNIGYSAEFGLSVSANGRYLLVGARGERRDESGGNSLVGAGAAYFFEKNDTSGLWQQVQKVVSPVRDKNKFFGASVAISGNFAVVGEPIQNSDSTGGNNVNGAGAAHVYERTGNGTWSLVRMLVAPQRQSQAEFGNSVAMHGDRMIIGAWGDGLDDVDSNYVQKAGAAYLYEKDGQGNWMLSKKIVAPVRKESAEFGTAVSIYDADVIVGTMRDNFDLTGENKLDEAGSAYISGPAINTDISYMRWEKAIKIFPNPTRGKISIDLEEILPEVSIQIRTLTGQLIQSETFRHTNLLLVNITGPSGLYIIEIRNSEGYSTLQKVIKQ